MPAVSLWAAVPHYVSQPPNPKATLALLNRLEDLLDLRIPLGELPEDARAWQVGVDQLAAEDSEVAEYVQTLEEARDTAELPEASGEAIAREFERYLRRGPRHGGYASEGGDGVPDPRPARSRAEEAPSRAERDPGRQRFVGRLSGPAGGPSSGRRRPPEAAQSGQTRGGPGRRTPLACPGDRPCHVL